MSLLSDIFEINRRLTNDFWHLKSVHDEPHELSPRLICPEKRDKKVRISEQEAKTLYISILNGLNYYYSVETPTSEGYIQKGKKPQSGNTDLSLYKFDYNMKEFIKAVNVEFKKSPVAEENIRKDIEKLIRERTDGAWIHTIENANSNNIHVLFDKMKSALKSCKDISCLKNANSFLGKSNDNSKIVKNVSIVFYFYCIECRWACMKHFIFSDFKYDNIEAGFLAYIDNFFKIDYKLEDKGKYNVIKIINRNDWITISHDEYLTL